MIQGKRVLLVDDDLEYQRSVASFLAGLGLFVIPVDTNKKFLEALDKDNPDIAIVDKEIGFEDGFDLIYAIRKHPKYGILPIIVVSGKVSQENKVEAIRIGADDILPKPLNLQDLQLRIQANLRRSHSYLLNDQTVKVAGIEINLRYQNILIHGDPIDLTKTEYKIFSEMILKRDQIVSRDAIAQKFLSFKNQNNRTIDVHVTSLRKKLGDYGRCIKTVRGRGYLFHIESN